jgi:hypothetical protein
VFYNYIHSDFVGIRDGLNSLNPSINISQVKFKFLTENSKVIGPSTDGLKIEIFDTFLSYLWTLCYSIFITTPLSGGNITQEEILEAKKLRQYGMSLFKEYTPWDKESLPNPELIGKDNKKFIGYTNSLYLAGVRFILFHEFAHIHLGHPFVKAKFRTSENLIKMENDADATALMFALQNADKTSEFVEKMAIIIALISLCFTPSKFSESATHPAPEDRIKLCAEKLNLNDNDPIWGIATWAIMEWQATFEIFHLPNYNPEIANKFYFYEMYNELKEFKKTGVNKFQNKKS